MIVVDLGCFPHRHEVSLEPLVKRYRPQVLYGFDPWPELIEGETQLDGTRVILERKAAWIEDGVIEYARVRGLRAWDSTVMREKNSRGEWSSSGSREVIRVPCFDFSAWLRSLLEQPVVKIDVEGAEFPILKRMVDEGTDALVAELLVEWHDDKMEDFAERKARLLSQLRCPVTDWEPEGGGGKRAALRGFWKGRRMLGAR